VALVIDLATGLILLSYRFMSYLLTGLLFCILYLFVSKSQLELFKDLYFRCSCFPCVMKMIRSFRLETIGSLDLFLNHYDEERLDRNKLSADDFQRNLSNFKLFVYVLFLLFKVWRVINFSIDLLIYWGFYGLFVSKNRATGLALVCILV
jgi:hypothetical protein